MIVFYRKESKFVSFRVDPFSEERHFFKDVNPSESVLILLNPFIPSMLFYFKSLDWSISCGRDVWLGFDVTCTMFIKYKNSCILMQTS